MDHPPRKELEDLLLSMFTEADVRRFVRDLPGGEHIHAELPGAAVSLKDLVHQAVNGLERHGRLERHFFEALTRDRPARSAEIQALATRMPRLEGLGSPDDWLVGLPEPLHARLVGRERELAALDAAWNDPGTHVLSIVGLGWRGQKHAGASLA